MYFFLLIILLTDTVIFNLPFRAPTGLSREWNFSAHKSQGVRVESPWLTDDLCGKVLIRTGHCLACSPPSTFPAALSPSPFTLPAGSLVTQASAEFISHNLTQIAHTLHICKDILLCFFPNTLIIFLPLIFVSAICYLLFHNGVTKGEDTQFFPFGYSINPDYIFTTVLESSLSLINWISLGSYLVSLLKNFFYSTVLHCSTVSLSLSGYLVM